MMIQERYRFKGDHVEKEGEKVVTINECLSEFGRPEVIMLDVPVKVVMPNEADDYETTVPVPGYAHAGGRWWTDMEERFGAIEVVPLAEEWVSKG